MRNRVVSRIFIAFLLVLSVVACKLNDQSSLYGTYFADYDVAREKLTLNKNGTFVQEVTLKATSKIDIAKGTWAYNTESGYVTFHGGLMGVLDGFRKFNPDYAHPTKSGSAVQPVLKLFGRIRIGSNEGILYRKSH